MPKKQGKYSPTQMLRVHGGFADACRKLASTPEFEDSVVDVTRTIFYAMEFDLLLLGKLAKSLGETEQVK